MLTCGLLTDDVIAALAALRSEAADPLTLVTIAALRARIARDCGAEAASHAELDPMLKWMRKEGMVRLVAINVLADGTAAELADAIPGMNETLFFID